tara:strand:- start:1580 stop:2263 length:684 start_codon:yes stop_codon:yes gene_type:complete
MDYKIDIFDNHIVIIDKEKRFLIDTGSPISISDEAYLDAFNESYKSRKTYHGANIHEISNLAGCSLNALIGTDILANYVFQVDFDNKLFSIWDSLPEEIKKKEDYIDADFKGIPTIDVLINEKDPITSWLDTGAKISYINKNYVKYLEPSDNQKDFFPSYGEFEVPIYNIPLTFNGAVIPFKFGVLPEALEGAMLSGSTSAIIGADIFYNFTLTFHFSKKKIYVKGI